MLPLIHLHLLPALALAGLSAAATRALSTRVIGEGFELVQCTGPQSYAGLAFFKDWYGRGAPGGNFPDELIPFLLGSTNAVEEVVEDANCVFSESSGALTCWTFEDGANLFSAETEIGTALNSFKSHYICFRGSGNQVFNNGDTPCLQLYYCIFLYQL